MLTYGCIVRRTHPQRGNWAGAWLGDGTIYVAMHQLRSYMNIRIL